MDMDNITIDDLIKSAAQEAQNTPMPPKKEEDEEEKKEKKENAEKQASFLETLADSLEKIGEALPLDEAPVPGEQKKTQDKPIPEHDKAPEKGPQNAMKNDERDPVKDTQGHLGHPDPKMEAVTPDPPKDATSAPAKVATILRDLQNQKVAEQLGYDSNPQAAHDRSTELLNEPNQVGHTEPEASSGKVDKNQQVIDETPRDLADQEKKDMAKLVKEPMQSKAHDKVLADAFPNAEPKAKPKIAEYLKEAAKQLKSGKKDDKRWTEKATSAARDIAYAPGGMRAAWIKGKGEASAEKGLAPERVKAMEAVERSKLPVSREQRGKNIGGVSGALGGGTAGAILGALAGKKGKAVSRILRGSGGAAAGGAAGTLAGSLAGKYIGRAADYTKRKTASEDISLADVLRARQAQIQEGA